MALKHAYASQDEIPETYRELFSQKGDQWELTGVAGVRTQADVDRLKTALDKERNEHKTARERLNGFTALGEIEDIQKTLDRVPELEAAAAGKLDDAAIEEIVEKRLKGTLQTRLAPVERELKKAMTERETLLAEVTTLRQEKHKRELVDTLRPSMTESKVLPEHFEDVEMYASLHFERQEDGSFITKEGVGVTPGMRPKEWLEEMLQRKPGWLPHSVGGGARGSGGGGGGGDNPWSASGWNMTAQGVYLRTHGREKAEAMAKRAGTTLGGPRPKAQAAQ